MTTETFFRTNIFSKLVFFLIAIYLFIFSSCCKDCDCKHNCPEEPEFDYTNYFIAHAGGAIDGYIYTNCLEALDLSYSKGCKLFELDLVVTADGKIVAAHGWENFKIMTNYPGNIDNNPLTEKEFLSLKIYDKYTPLNMKAINQWFEDHPDAILVTDKINDPQRIYNEFLFRNRVIMELFSWGAVDKAIELGVKPMVSSFLFFETPNFEQIFEEKKIKYICMGRYQMAGYKELFRILKVKGIKNYVWSLEWPINGQPAEEYVWDHEMSYYYGMYANDLDLLESLLKGQPAKKREPVIYNNPYEIDFNKMK